MCVTGETCWDCPAFGQFWDRVADALEDVPDEGWRLDEIIDAFNAGKSVQDALNAIEDNYDPTPMTPYEFFHS